MKQQKSNALSVSAPLHPFLCLSPPPSFPPSVLLLASGRTIKSFPGLSHPMSRMMRICSLNQNSHLLHPPPPPSALLFVAFSVIFSHSFIASFIYHLSLFILSVISISLPILQQLFSCLFPFFRCLLLWLSRIYTVVSLSFSVFSLNLLFFLSLYEAVCHCLLPATALLVCLLFIFF